jgi:hypothetical protein
MKVESEGVPIKVVVSCWVLGGGEPCWRLLGWFWSCCLGRSASAGRLLCACVVQQWFHWPAVELFFHFLVGQASQLLVCGVLFGGQFCLVFA